MRNGQIRIFYRDFDDFFGISFDYYTQSSGIRMILKNKGIGKIIDKKMYCISFIDKFKDYARELIFLNKPVSIAIETVKEVSQLLWGWLSAFA